MSDAPSNLAIRTLLAQHNLRYSRPREIILAYFREADRHVNAEGLYSELKKTRSQPQLINGISKSGRA